MKSENDPVSKDEFVLRRIHKNHFNPALRLPVIRFAFRPTPKDKTGLSVFRQLFVAPSELAATGRKPGEYYIARLSVRDVIDQLGLSVAPDPDEKQPRGHALIPELHASNAGQPRAKEVQLMLVKLASRSIAHRPTAPAER